MLRQIAFIALAAAAPFAAAAQSVPAIQTDAQAHADGQGAQAAASYSASSQQGSNPTLGSGTPAKPPQGWPPTPQMLAPSTPLDHKEKTAVTLATQWRNKADRPMRDAEGVLRWRFGSSQARLVCAPLQICDIEMKPGETINNIRLGDVTFWTTTLAISGGLDGRTTHVSMTPIESGRVTSMVIYTDQRTYSLKLVSTQRDYTPRIGFTYPDTQETQNDNWNSYRVAVAGGGMGKAGPAVPGAAGGVGSVDASRIEMLEIKGDNPSWRPIVAYTDTRKTYIQFPAEMPFGESPSLLGVNDDGGLFSSPTERRVIYRVQGDKLIADTVMDKLKLVLGVGASAKVVTLTRQRR